MDKLVDLYTFSDTDDISSNAGVTSGGVAANETPLMRKRGATSVTRPSRAVPRS